MTYRQMLNMHALKSHIAHVDIPAKNLGLNEYHGSIPNRFNFRSSIIEHVSKSKIKTYDDMMVDSLYLDIRPEAFPQTGYLGGGVK